MSLRVLSAPSLDVLTVSNPLCKSMSLRTIFETSSGRKPCLLMLKTVIHFWSPAPMILSIRSSVGIIIGSDCALIRGGIQVLPFALQ